jgi:hypothetical protein
MAFVWEMFELCQEIALAKTADKMMAGQYSDAEDGPGDFSAGKYLKREGRSFCINYCLIFLFF